MDENDVRWTLDQLELRNLIAKLAQAIDLDSLEEYASCWDEAAEWLPPASPVHIPAGERRGLREIVEGAEARRVMVTKARAPIPSTLYPPRC